MSCSLQSFRRANLLLCLGLFLHCEASVLTEVQAGPLYRVVDSPLSITCNVSGFKNVDAEKEFEFRFKKPGLAVEINVISTHKQDFSYALFSSRVRSGEVTLTHLSANSVIFKIERLKKGDEGEYDCTAVDLELLYNGLYSVQTTVKVIDDSLSVSSPASTSLSYNEGDALTLTCQASSNTVQHTHLSLAWYLHKDGEDEAQPIISLNRDFTLSPGQGFEGRYQAGLISLDKVGEATYKLKMAQLELSDQGSIYCQAQEWIQDPDRSWYSIVKKKAAETTTLTVKAREVVPDTSSLLVRISAQQTTLQEGQELSLSCTVDTQNPEEKFFAVAWFKDSVEMARIGPTGVVSVGPSYSVRSKEGELRAARTGARDYHLILQPIRTEDQGQYFCRAWPFDRGQDGAFTQRAAQDSSPQPISISATESGLSLSMQSSASVNEGDRLHLTCTVQGVKGLLSVTWQRKASSTATAAFTEVIGLSQEGVMEKAQEFMSRKIRATRPAADSFTLEFDEVTQADSGVYQCTVSEWKADKTKTNSQSQTATVTVAPADTFVKLKLVSRKSVVALGESVELMCRVIGPRVPLTLTWSLQRDSSNPDNILTLYSDGGIGWFGDESTYQLRVENKNNEVVHYLLINGASERESGSYRCSASVFQQNVYKKLTPSNQLALKVQKPASKLAVTTAPSLTSDVNTDIEIKCSVITQTSLSSRYAVTWLLQQGAENKTIISSDQDAIITFGPQVVESLRQRISMRRAEGPSFELTIRQAEISDGGSYICRVVEWIQAPRGEWFELSQVSKTTKITVAEPANDLRVGKINQTLSISEGNEAEVTCNITSGATSPSFFYKVTWFYTGPGSSVTNPLVELDHTGVLSYLENEGLRGLQRRLRLSRPTQNSFYLGIQRAHEGDSGTYMCRVEQYQLDRDGQWQQKASENSSSTTLTVNLAGKNLSILKEEKKLNASVFQDFTIPCHITNQSSNESVFQVTWFWQKETENKRKSPIFTAYRNSTLEDKSGNAVQLRFSHPLPNQFNLAVVKPNLDHSGLYYCEVEEWLQSLSHGWRKVAVETSGHLTVHVSTEGDADAHSEPACRSGMWIGIFVAYVMCTIVVIAIVVVKGFHKRGKKSEPSLWAEEHALNTKPSTEY